MLGRIFVALLRLVIGSLWLNPILSHAQEAKTLQEQLEEQKAKNESLRARIAKLEEVLKSDVCANPEAEKLLEREGGDRVPDAKPPSKR